MNVEEILLLNLFGEPLDDFGNITVMKKSLENCNVQNCDQLIILVGISELLRVKTLMASILGYQELNLENIAKLNEIGKQFHKQVNDNRYAMIIIVGNPTDLQENTRISLMIALCHHTMGGSFPQSNFTFADSETVNKCVRDFVELASIRLRHAKTGFV